MMKALVAPKEVKPQALTHYARRERKRQKLDTKHSSTIYFNFGKRVLEFILRCYLVDKIDSDQNFIDIDRA